MTNRIILIGAALFGISLGMFFLMAAVVKNFWSSKKKIFIYVIVVLIIFSLVALLVYPGLIESPTAMLMIFQGCFLGLGVLHIWALNAYMDWGKSDSIWPEIIFSLFIWLIGLVPFYFIYAALSGSNGYLYYMLGSSIFFIVPFLFFKTFFAAVAMPLPKMELWFYPVHLEIPDPEAHELENPFVITFIIPKKVQDAEPTKFRAKAPENMNLGGLFYFFVEDFNEQNVENILEYTDKFGQPYGWVFYFQPKWYLLYTKYYVDPAQTVKENSIKEDSVIICERAATLDEDENDTPALKGEISSY